MQRCLQRYLTSITDDGNEETMTSVEVSDWCKTIPVCQVIWQYMNESNKFVDMPQDYSAKYEEHFREGTLNFEYNVPYAKGTKTYHYKVNFPDMTQSNAKTGKVRNLRRLIARNP